MTDTSALPLYSLHGCFRSRFPGRVLQHLLEQGKERGWDKSGRRRNRRRRRRRRRRRLSQSVKEEGEIARKRRGRGKTFSLLKI